jgi:hypothetical protein
LKYFAIALFLCLTVVAANCTPALCQNPQPAPSQPVPAAGESSHDAPPPGSYTLKVTAREVVVDVVALDQNQYPVKDLKMGDLSLFEVTKHAKIQRRIASLHAIDPVVDDEEVEQNPGGFRISLPGTCAISNRFHYRIAYQPTSDGWAGGYHEIAVKSSRPKVSLSYRHRYYVGETNVSEKPRVHEDATSGEELRLAACFHSTTPPSIGLNARQVKSGSTNALVYSLIVQPDSLALTSMSEELRKVQLDYGACTFSQEGKPLQYSHLSAEKTLSQKEYDEVLDKGYPNTLQLPLTGEPALARLVVRDRAPGSIGWINVSTAVADSGKTVAAQAAAATPTSFGSIGKVTESLCGDVYEVPVGTRFLPEYGNMESIGEIYTQSLNVPHHYDSEGVLGLTLKPEWFGIDYYGKFWVSVPGVYRFSVASDDGSQLWIDDKRVFDLDGVHSVLDKSGAVTLAEGFHTIHIPYFQETNWVALTLQIQAPGEKLKTFDLREFAKPAAVPAHP